MIKIEKYDENANMAKKKEIFTHPYDRTKPADLLTFVTAPFAQRMDIDPVSKIYQTFQATKASPAIAIFYFFAVMSHWNLLRDVTYKIPNDNRTHIPNLWLMALAGSGASKTQQLTLLNGLIDDELKSSFNQPASPASFIEQFSENPVQLWVEDEAAKYLKQIENPTNPLSPIKGHMLKAKGGDRLTYHSKKDGAKVIEKPRLSIYFVNTILGMFNTISEESMYDGFLSRISLVLSETPEHMKTDIGVRFPDELHDTSGINASGLEQDLDTIFEQDIEGKQYTFGEDARLTYEYAVKSMRGAFEWMQGENNQYAPFFNRTVLESFKYALFHHQMIKKEGTEVDAFSMEYGLQVARFNLCSFARYLQLRDDQRNIVATKAEARVIQRMDSLRGKIFDYTRQNTTATLRDIYRVFAIKKGEAEVICKEIGFVPAPTKRGRI
jgi:hypothetical protein